MTNKDTASEQSELQRYLDWYKNAQTSAEARNAKACIESFIKRAAQQSAPEASATVDAQADTTTVSASGVKDHEIRELVNELRDIALAYHDTQQLRARIHNAVLTLFCRAPAPSREAAPLTDEQIGTIYRHTFPAGPYLITPDGHKFARAVIAALANKKGESHE